MHIDLYSAGIVLEDSLEIHRGDLGCCCHDLFGAKPCDHLALKKCSIVPAIVWAWRREGSERSSDERLPDLVVVLSRLEMGHHLPGHDRIKPVRLR
jgi:hypothetical protein